MRNKLLLSGILTCGLALPALADWDIGDPNTKWMQLPQLIGGYDVMSMQGTYPTGLPAGLVVADDWECRDPRPVTDIHIWGSWWNNQPAPGWEPTFQLTIYSDIPAGVGALPYSTPGDVLWRTVQGAPPERLVFADAVELFYDPSGLLADLNLSPEWEVWQYNFFLDPSEYFHQTPGTIYWLSVEALNLEPYPGHYWGWKTSETQWNDDAAWRLTAQAMDWQELIDPEFNPGQSLDMAFVLTVPEPQTYALAVGLTLLGFAAWRRRRL